MLSDIEIIDKLARNRNWSEGKFHTSINRLYLDVICPKECSVNKIEDGIFCYCEECSYGNVCYQYKGAIKKFGTLSMI